MYSQVHVSTYNTALAAAKAGQWQEAMGKLETLVAEQPADVLALNLLGKVYFHNDEQNRASDCWHRALVHSPNDPVAQACLDALNRRVLPKWGAWSIVWLFFCLVFVSQLTLLWYLRDVRRELGVLAENSSVMQTDGVLTPGQRALQPQPDKLAGHESDVSQTSAVPEAEPTVEMPQIPAEELYAQAVADYRQGTFREAETKLRQLTAASDLPTGLADNVLYWLAACALAQDRRVEAGEFIARLLDEYPTTNKQEDAQGLLKRAKIP